MVPPAASQDAFPHSPRKVARGPPCVKYLQTRSFHINVHDSNELPAAPAPVLGVRSCLLMCFREAVLNLILLLRRLDTSVTPSWNAPLARGGPNMAYRGTQAVRVVLGSLLPIARFAAVAHADSLIQRGQTFVLRIPCALPLPSAPLLTGLESLLCPGRTNMTYRAIPGAIFIAFSTTKR